MEGTPGDYDELRTNLALSYVEACLDLHFRAMEWSDEDVILDIGCGPGRTTRDIILPKCPKLKKIVAIDIDPSHIEYARKTYFHEKIEFKERDILKMVDDSKKYDKIVSIFAFHLIPDVEELYSVISSILKPGGYFSFIIYIKGPLFSMIRELSINEEWKKFIKTEDLLGSISPIGQWEDVQTELKSFVSKFGLRVIESKCESISTSFSNKKHYLDFTMAALPKVTFKNIEPEIKQSLWNHARAVASKYLNESNNGEFSITGEILLVFGVKE